MDEVLETGLLFGQPALIWASATLAVLVLPIVIVSTIEALKFSSKISSRCFLWIGRNKMANN